MAGLARPLTTTLLHIVFATIISTLPIASKSPICISILLPIVSFSTSYLLTNSLFMSSTDIPVT